jgi:hypothetical protein
MIDFRSILLLSISQSLKLLTALNVTSDTPRHEHWMQIVGEFEFLQLNGW